MRKQEAESSFEVRGMSEELRGKSEEVSSLFPSRSRLLALFLLALPSSLLALPSSLSPLENGLQFNGSNWIETGYCHTERDRIECEITVDAAQANASAAVFGTEGAGDETRAFAFYVKTDGDDVATYTFGRSVSGAWFPRGDRATLRLEPANADWEVLRRGETLGAVREGTDSTVVDGPTVATGTTLTLTDADKDRPKNQAFYIVEAK